MHKKTPLVQRSTAVKCTDEKRRTPEPSSHSTGSLAILFSNERTSEGDDRAVLAVQAEHVFRVTSYEAMDDALHPPGTPTALGADRLVLLESSEHVFDSLWALNASAALVYVASTVPTEQAPFPTSVAHSGLLVCLMNCSDRARDEEFLAWYDDVHIPEVVGTGTYHGGVRLVPDPESARASSARTASLWSTKWEDPRAALTSLYREHNPRMTLWTEVTPVHVRSYRRLRTVTR